MHSADMRRAAEARWNERLSGRGLFSSDSLSGSSPPSVFVGSYGYPRVGVGPMVPPVHGDTALLDAPERWAGRTAEEVIDFRLGLVRGVRPVRVGETSGRYIESLQEMAMSERPADSDIRFDGPAVPSGAPDGQSAPFGPVGRIRNARFSSSPAQRRIEKAYYDTDLRADEAVMELYDGGIEVSRIQRCFSVGMLGRRRRLVPTRWSITATDDIISRALVRSVLDAPLIDSHRVFFFEQMSNLFSVVLFPHRWVYEMTEAWYSGGALGFGSDREDARGIGHPPAIAGAYFAARLAVAEYLARHGVQAGVLVLREIRPEYSIPVGVWQVREAVRAAMGREPEITDGFGRSLDAACRPMNVSRREWLSHGRILDMIRQRSMSDFF